MQCGLHCPLSEKDPPKIFLKEIVSLDNQGVVFWGLSSR
jgi:hypothetical protein